MNSKTTRSIAFIIGTRPEAIKLAPVIQSVKGYEKEIQPIIISTGQHREMLNQVFDIYGIEPDIDLEIMEENQSLEKISEHLFIKLPKILSKHSIDFILIQGDTSTAFIAGLIGYYSKIPIGHVEAGLRTHNPYNPFPEEMNRRLISTLSTLNFAPTSTNRKNLINEGIRGESIIVTGNTVIDSLLIAAEKDFEFKDNKLKSLYNGNSKIILLTAHRRENHGKPLENICEAIIDLVKGRKDIEVVCPVHLNPNVKNPVYKQLSNKNRIHLITPVDYLSFVNLMKISHLILTDSGGIQEEAPSLNKPVLVLRATTERPEAVSAGAAKVIGTDKDTIVDETTRLLDNQECYRQMSNAINPYGDGKASKRIIDYLLHYFGLLKKPIREFDS